MEPFANSYSTKDKSSLSNSEDLRLKSTHLNWTLDFESKTISGSVVHTIEVLTEGTSSVDFDSSKLAIQSVKINTQPTAFNVGENVPALGNKVSVVIPEILRGKGAEINIQLFYSTDPDASAIQWLEPSATHGGNYPYVFTQSQAIHARSLLPCFDSPGVKAPYTATIKAPTWCTVLMSALAGEVTSSKASSKKQDSDRTTYRWNQPVPTPAYLIALAAGELQSRDISPRVRVWSEPGVVDAAAYEFAETEEFLSAAESLTCPYQWGRYDVLCLPPSFPYGGMENPCLTFATPTLLAGDRSLADVIAHEIAHSWTGNLVTNHTWEHFWLNEGWTVWLERKIMARVKNGEEHRMLSAQGGWKGLKDDISRQQNGPFTSLVWPLAGDDPDDAFSRVPYEKGFNLLYYLEGLVGGEPFEEFAKAYIDKYKFSTVTSGEFKDFFSEYFSTRPQSSRVVGLDWASLLLSPGMPVTPVPDFSNRLSAEVESAAERWLACATSLVDLASAASEKSDVLKWSSAQTCIFLDTLLDSDVHMDETFLKCLDGTFEFSKTNNAEIKFRWQMLCLRSDVPWIVDSVVAFVKSQGRMKYVRPLYRALRNSSVGCELAGTTFAASSGIYHPIARKMIANDLAAADAVDAAEAGNGTSGAAAAASVAAVAAEVTSAHVATTTAAEVVAATASSGGSPVVQARAVPMAVPVSSTRSAANVAAAAPAAAEHAPATAESSSTSPSTSLFGVAVAGAAIAAITAIALLRSRK